MDEATGETDVRVTVLVDDEHLASVVEVAERLRAEGMRVEAADELGTVRGTVPRSRLARLAEVEGVEEVELARTFLLPPPDDGTQ